ncbi:MAG: hypothetical protein R3251_03855 [Candidatus Spechtbacterales bacterium]|nr:hypothetical protein [Candidatus Spechtbacterales bacterium]
MKYYKLCVSGAADTGHCEPDALKKAEELGREIVRHNAVLVTGATTGTPFWAAKGAKAEDGFSVGFSPAYSEKEHIDYYNLPTEYMDIIIYTGFDFSGRNLMLTRAADAVFIVCGRSGTMNEFTVAFEDNKPIGVLEGTGGTADLIRELLPKMHKGQGKVVFDTDPKRLVEKVLELVKKEKMIELPTHRHDPALEKDKEEKSEK